MEELIVAFSVSASLIAACLYLHFKALRNGALTISKLGASVRRQMLLVMRMIFLTHLLEIIIFAIAIWGMARIGACSLSGAHTSTAADFFYFSIASYTTLGIGDITPEGPIRVLVGIEALTGLLLIAWRASVTYLTMERIWTPETN